MLLLLLLLVVLVVVLLLVVVVGQVGWVGWVGGGGMVGEAVGSCSVNQRNLDGHYRRKQQNQVCRMQLKGGWDGHRWT